MDSPRVSRVMSNDEDQVKWAQGELPNWLVLEYPPPFIARSPTFKLDGVTVSGETAEMLVERVRNFVRVLAIASGHAGRLDPSQPVGGVEVSRDASEPPPASPEPQLPPPSPTISRSDARAMGYTGDVCPDCGVMNMVRNGMCLKCMRCGATTGCS